MATAVADAPLSAVPGIPDAGDDLPDPPAPPGAYAPLAVDQHQELLGALRILGRVIDSAWERLPELLDARTEQLLARLTAPEAQLRPVDAGALEHLCEILETIQARGMTISGTPYTCTMQALTPQGFPVSVSIARQDGEAFFAAVQGMADWLAASGYAIPPAAVAF